MMKLNSKNWQKVRLNVKSKLITFTSETTFKTKSECEATIKSNQYVAINKLGLERLLADGYTINQPKEENAVEVKELAQNVVDLTGNAEVEAQIEAYAQAKIERDIKAYADKKAKEQAVKNFLATPPKQEKQKPFDYDKQLKNFYTKQKPRNERALSNQMAEYTEV